MSENKVIYSMVRVGKTYPPNNQVLRDISLSYFYGAKIGVIGLNGSGKSTLLRIMAGVEQDFNGHTILSEGFTVGYLEQEPHLDDSKTARQIVEEGVRRKSWTPWPSSTPSTCASAKTSPPRRWTN